MTQVGSARGTGVAQAYSATGAAWQRGPGRIYDRLAEVLVDQSPVPLRGRTVLDVGAGTGAAARAIRRHGGDVVALDVAVGMLRAMGGLGPCVVGDARQLPVASDRLGGVVAAFSFNHVPDPERALAEAARVVGPGSPVLVSAYAHDDHHPVKAAVDQAAGELGWEPEPWVSDLRAASIPVLSTVEGAHRVADSVPLASVEVRRVEVPFPDLDLDDLVAWRCGMAQVAPFVARLDPDQRDELHRRARQLVGRAPELVRRVIVLAAVA